MVTQKFELELFLIIILATIVSLYIIFQRGQQFQVQAVTPLPSVFSTPAQIPSAIPSPFLIPTIKTTSWVSPDGNSQVTLSVKNTQDSSSTYSFYVASPIYNTNSKQIFSKTVDNKSSISTPFNTFSPDNNYIFLTDNEPDMTHYLVFNATGQPFANGQQYLDVSELFRQYTSSYSLYQVTGWASNTLLVIETSVNNASGPSFWFDVTNGSFIRLATQF